jgi:3-methyladenine DNA glycosylase Mpg
MAIRKARVIVQKKGKSLPWRYYVNTKNEITRTSEYCIKAEGR